MKVIEDPTRVVKGDLVVIPSERDAARKRLHLGSATTYGGHGLSMGFTCRSDNSPDTIRRLLCEDPGHPRTFYVFDTQQKWYYSDNVVKYGGLLGGSRTVREPDAPQIVRAWLRELPYEGADCEWTLIRMWSECNRNAVAERLAGLLQWRHFVRRNVPDTTGDRALIDAFDSNASRTDDNNDYTTMNEFVPSDVWSPDASETALNEPALKEFLGVDMFRSGMSSRTDSKEHTLTVTPKFLTYARECGARILRPDESFVQRIAQYCTERMMLRYAERQTEVLKRVNKFVHCLKDGINTTKWRGKSALEVAKKLHLRKAETEILYKGLK